MAKKITAEVLRTDAVLRAYLAHATFSRSRRGDGVFVSAPGIAPETLRAYGIVLPKGGMIIPNATPEKILAVVMADHDAAQEEDATHRATDRERCVNRAKALLRRCRLDDVDVVVKERDDCRGIGSTKVIDVVLRRGEDDLLVIRSEREPYRALCASRTMYRKWAVEQLGFVALCRFVIVEVRLVPIRKRFAARVERLVAMSYEVGQQAVGEDGWDRPRVEYFLYDNYREVTDWGFFGKRCKSVYSAHRLMYRKQLYKFTEEDMQRLEREVEARAHKADARKRVLRERFFAACGVLSYTEHRCDTSDVRHSLLDGRVKDDSWLERRHFVGDMELTNEERAWLRTLLPEVPVPEGYVRVSNDTNELLRVPPVPDQSRDVLVVVGKTGSRRGVWEYGEWYRGHPSAFRMSLYDSGTRRKLKSITLNGKEITHIDPRDWTDPKRVAQRALQEAGITPTVERIAALADYCVADGLLPSST